jgi:hypothetical protein
MSNASRLRLETDVPRGADRRSIEHELWLAMQAAHHHHVNASAALEVLTATAIRESSSSEASPRMQSAIGEQRTAFEHYIEARLQFAEFLLSRDDAAAMSRRDTSVSRTGSASFRLAILVIVVALLCPIILGLIYLNFARKHLLELDAARNEASANLSEARSQIRIIAGRLDALNAIRQLAIERHSSAPATLVSGERGHSARLQSRPARRAGKAPIAAPPKRNAKPDNQIGSSARNRHKAVRGLKRPERGNRQFVFTRPNRFGRVCPIGLSIRTVDPNQKSFDLSMRVDDFDATGIPCERI